MVEPMLQVMLVLDVWLQQGAGGVCVTRTSKLSCSEWGAVPATLVISSSGPVPLTQVHQWLTGQPDSG